MERSISTRASIMRCGDMPFCRIPSMPRCDFRSRRAMAIEPIPAQQDAGNGDHPSTTRSVDSEQQSGGSKAEALLSRNAHTENLRSATLLSYVVDSATSAHRRHNLSAAGGRLVTSTSASPMEHTTALRRSAGCLRALPMYTCSGSVTRGKVAPWSMLDTSVSEGAQRSFPGDVCRRRPAVRRGFLVVDSTEPRHLWGSDGRIFDVSFFYFLGQA